MTASSTIASTWQTYIFDYSTIQGITKKANAFEMIQDSETALEKLHYGGAVNAFCYKAVQINEQRLTRTILHTHVVTVDYYREQDPAGMNWKAVRDALETLATTVRTQLGNTWQGSVDYWRYRDTEPEIEQVTIGSTPCWRGRVVYEAYSTTSL